MPSLGANNNTLFGGTLINQKYSPLESIEIADQDKAFYVQLFNNRITALSQPNLFPKKLSLFTSAWPNPIDVDTPPMVVISSNRAEWLETILDNAVAKYKAAPFTGYNDPKTFDNGPVPWYAPRRSQRPLFIVVHHAEYGYYKKLLDGYWNTYVVGWRVPFSKGQFGPAGFGASRFAALELVKALGYHYAWAVDDNVVNINGFPNVLTTIEALMTAQIAGIGFSAATINKVFNDLYNGTATLTTTNFVFGNQTAGLLQQVVLWNLDILRTDNLNMSPYFVTSNEDVSLTNYLQAYNYDERVIKPLSIMKMQPTNDANNPGAAELTRIRTALHTLLYNLESNTQIIKGTAQPVSLSSFVTNTILPNSQNQNGSLQVTQSMAIEQVLAMAVSKKWAPVKIFNPYDGFQGTKVERLAG